MRAWLLLALLLAGCIGPAPSTREAVAAPAVLDVRLTPPDQAASEVSIAVDPTDPMHLVAAANSGGGFAVHTSRDGGRTWGAERVRSADLFDAATAARLGSLSDPVVAFAPDGTVHLAGLAYLPGSAVFVAHRTDGGWRGVVVHESEIAAGFNDKEWLGIHPQTGTMLLAWQKEPALDQLRDVEQRLGGTVDLDVGDIVVSHSTDGVTWSEPAVVSGPSRHNNGTQVAYTPDGRTHLLWVDYEAPGLVHAASPDDGRTWSRPRAVAELSIVGSYDRYARMHTLPALAAGPEGHLFAVWHGDRHGDADILVAASLDGALTWQEPVRVGPGEAGDGVVQFYPWATVDAEGSLWVSYYDATPDPERGAMRYVVQRCTPRLVCGEPVQASNETFEPFTDTGGRSLGDYTGIAVGGAGVVPA